MFVPTWLLICGGIFGIYAFARMLKANELEKKAREGEAESLSESEDDDEYDGRYGP